MKVLFATGLAHEMGGGAKYASQLQVEFNKKGVDSQAVPYTNLELSLPIGIRHFVYFCRFLIPLMRADVALAFDTWSVGIPSLLAAKILGKPFIVRVGGDFLWEQYVERTGDIVKVSEIYDTRKDKFNFKERIVYRGTKFLLKHADVLACNSQFQIDLWRRVYGIPLAQAIVVENLYPPHKQSTPATKKNFVAAGRAMKLKQDPMLISLFEEIQKEHSDVSLDMQSLPPEEHQQRVSSCYALVLASVSDFSPNVIIDAIINGKPFVCTKDTGIRERVGHLGFFVDTQNKDELKSAIVDLLDPAIYDAKKREIDAFSFTRNWSKVADDFLVAIKKCVS